MNIIQKLLITAGIIISLSFNNNFPGSKKEPPFRGFMIDAPRTVETMEYYFRLIDFCQKKGLNSIIFRLTDDQGSAYRFLSLSEAWQMASQNVADMLAKNDNSFKEKKDLVVFQLKNKEIQIEKVIKNGRIVFEHSLTK